MTEEKKPEEKKDEEKKNEEKKIEEQKIESKNAEKVVEVKEETAPEEKAKQVFIPVTPPELLDKVQNFKSDGYRLGQACCSKVGEEFQILYSFDKDGELVNLKMIVPEDFHVPSITPVIWAAFIYENEIHDLFGVKFRNLLLDFEGGFFRVATPTPWNPKKEDEEEGR